MIHDLKNKQNHIPALAALHFAEWSYLYPEETLEQRIRRMNTYLTDATIPRMFVRMDGDEAIGTAAIIESDMDTRPDQSPWLASVYVKEDRRGAGVGSELVRHVVAYAAKAGFEELFLFTPSRENFYLRMGWRTLARENYRGDSVTVMRYSLETRI